MLLVALALAFDFMNGFHDAANSIATVVSTGVLRPHYAVAWAAFFNFVAIFIFHLKVAATVGKGIVDPLAIDHYVIFGALIGAIIWNLITWYYGIPSSSSHALIGGMIGATMAKAGVDPLVMTGHPEARSPSSSSRPLLGMLLGALIMVRGVLDLPAFGAAQGGPLVPPAAARVFGRLQHRPRQQRRAEDHGHHLAAADLGRRDDGRSAMPPSWVIVSCYVAIALGTMFGGWRIVKTMGQKITKLRPVGGFAAETGGADHAVHGVEPGHPGLDHAHDHGRHHRRRLGAAGARPCAGASRATS